MIEVTTFRKRAVNGELEKQLTAFTHAHASISSVDGGEDVLGLSISMQAVDAVGKIVRAEQQKPANKPHSIKFSNIEEVDSMINALESLKSMYLGVTPT